MIVLTMTFILLPVALSSGTSMLMVVSMAAQA
jgi:hypothetical protein